MANFWVIYERQENEAKEIAGTTAGLAKVAVQRPREAENKARWSGSPELAKVALVEGVTTAAEARAGVAAMFPGAVTQALVAVKEAEFLEGT